MPSPSKSTNHSQPSHKLDKLNLLFYSSGMAFLLMIPMWLYYDLPAFLTPTTLIAHPSRGHTVPHSVAYYFFMNGTVHFAQNIIAFIILSSTSPVTYSIASLIKRVAVICIAIVWFNQSVHPVQGFGIAMAFLGLWMYNSAKGDVEKGENKMRRVEAARDLILPSTNAEDMMIRGMDTLPLTEAPVISVTAMEMTTVYGRPRNMSIASQRSPIHHPSRPSYPTISPSGPQPHNHNHPNLHVKLPATISIPKRGTVSPLDSYPSPPPSLDESPLPSPAFLPMDSKELHQLRAPLAQVAA